MTDPLNEYDAAVDKLTEAEAKAALKRAARIPAALVKQPASQYRDGDGKLILLKAG